MFLRLLRVMYCCSALYLCMMLPSLQLIMGQADSKGHLVTSAAQGMNPASMKNIRITPVFVLSGLNAAKEKLVKDILVHEAVSWLEQVLKVRPLSGSIKLPRMCSGNYQFLKNDEPYCRVDCFHETKCGPVIIPEEHLMPCKRCDDRGSNCEEAPSSVPSVGVPDSDLVLYVSAVEVPNCLRGIVTHAGHCHQEAQFDRPIAAFLNFCPNSLLLATRNADAQLAATLHELIHALAFSEDLYPFFRDSNGWPRTERGVDSLPIRNFLGVYMLNQNTVRTVPRLQWTVTRDREITHFVKMIVTPTVVREARAHFNCSSLLGAELELQGGMDVAGMHWEKRVFGDDIMTALLSNKPVVSRITLALLEDSGWYLADYSYAGKLEWGKDKGCAFVNDSCGGWLEYAKERRLDISPFCSDREWRFKKVGCVDRRTRVGKCNIKEFNYALPREYKYLPKNRGGSAALSDYCPLFYSKDSNEGFQFVGKNCQKFQRSSDQIAMQRFGPNSRCFNQAKPWVAKRIGQSQIYANQTIYGAGCYQFECTERRVLIKVDNQIVRCGGKGQVKQVSVMPSNIQGFVFEGVLECPSYEEVCSEYDCLNMCSGHGICIEGECRCEPGYHGDDCMHSASELQSNCAEVVCRNHGTCAHTPSGRKCQCRTGFTGPYCGSKNVSNPCIPDPCGENGRCTRTRLGTDARCICYNGFEGRYCRLKPDNCSLVGRRCVHGTCSNDTLGICECEPGFSGLTCEIEDFCAATPCANGGTCTNNVKKGEFECTCPRGYKGNRCRNKQRPCNNHPCQNGARCQSKENAPHGEIVCLCEAGFTGEFCESSLD